MSAGKSRSGLSKITRPPIPLGFDHADQHDLLDDLLYTQLVVVSSPPGTGKSTLVATYIASRNPPYIWYQLDQGDNDPATFFYYLGIAARVAMPHQEPSEMPPLIPWFGEDISAFAKRYFQILFQHMTAPFLIVLDNYQDVADDAELHEAIKVACTELPPGGRIVLITSEKLPPNLARLRANEMMTIIEMG
jgi:LuxR family maltose regulon positive regulatory protein